MRRGYDVAFKDKVSQEAGNSQTSQYGNIDGESEFVSVKRRCSI